MSFLREVGKSREDSPDFGPSSDSLAQLGLNQEQSRKRDHNRHKDHYQREPLAFHGRLPLRHTDPARGLTASTSCRRRAVLRLDFARRYGSETREVIRIWIKSAGR